MSELVSNGVHIYQFPTDDETVADINSTMNVSSSKLLGEGRFLQSLVWMLWVLINMVKWMLIKV